MKLTFLGTAAAEGVPAVFCNCEVCKRARARRGKDIRTRSQILIDGDTLFDFPMDTYMHALTYGVDLSAIKRVLITHAHMDHCYPQEFCMRGAPFAYGLTEERVTVYCNSTVKEIFDADTAREIRPEIAQNIKVNVMRPFETACDGDMTITALPAKHTKGEDCLVYYVQRAGVGALLLNDTGVLDLEFYKRLGATGAKVDVATFDCTYGDKRHGPGRHMGLGDIVDQLELVDRAGLATERFVPIATHLSHNVALDHDGMCVAAKRFGVTVAYDGMSVEIG